MSAQPGSGAGGALEGRRLSRLHRLHRAPPQGITSRRLGLDADPLGSLCLSNIGGLGLPGAFSPPIPFAHAPIDLIVGTVTDRPVVRGGVAVVRPTLTMNLTVDARVADWQEVDGFAGSLRRHLGSTDGLG